MSSNGDTRPQHDATRKLRSWYLARLRKNALADETAYSATPATLVNRDRDAIQNLIQDHGLNGASISQTVANGWTHSELLRIACVLLLAVGSGLLVLVAGHYFK
jgi:hypothetical protein